MSKIHRWKLKKDWFLEVFAPARTIFFVVETLQLFKKKKFLPNFFFCVRLEKNFRNMSVFEKQMEHRKTYGLAMLLCDLDISVTGHDITWHHDVMVPRDMTYTQHVPSSFTTHNTVCAEFIKYNETFLIFFFYDISNSFLKTTKMIKCIKPFLAP